MLNAKVLATNEVSNVESSSRSKPVKPKTRKLSKSKKLSKSENLPEFAIRGAGPSFLTSDAKMAFNRLWLDFIKTPIL